MQNPIASLLSGLAERLPFHELDFQKMVQKKEVPVHKMSWAYYLGGLSLLFFIVQIATGLALLFYYEPTVSEAYESVEYITTHVSSGALIRNMHAWSASLMILTLMLHLLTTFSMKAFEKPRELSWITGVLLLLITFGFGFSGYLLPWNQIAVNATKVGLQTIEEMGSLLPASMAHIPELIRITIQGEASIGQATLSRFFALHVVFLPLAIMGLMGFHVLGVQLHGMSQGVDKPTGKSERFFPIFILKDFKEWIIAFLILFVLALTIPFDSFLPFPLLEPYDSLGSTPDGIKPEWYFFFIYYPMELLPFWVIMIAQNVGMVGLFLVPWIFKGTSRKTLRTIAITIGLYLFISTVFGGMIFEAIKGGH